MICKKNNLRDGKCAGNLLKDLNKGVFISRARLFNREGKESRQGRTLQINT